MKQLLGQHKKKQVRAAVANQFFELGAIVELVLQRAQVAQQASVTPVADRDEILRIKLRKERIAIAQMRVVRAQARFKNLPALADHFETPACRFAVAIVSSQVAKRLFALKDRGRSRLLSLPSVRGHVSTIPALR